KSGDAARPTEPAAPVQRAARIPERLAGISLSCPGRRRAGTYCRAFVRALPIPFPRPTYPDQPLGAVPEMGGHHHAGKHGDTSARLAGGALGRGVCGVTTRLFHVAGTGGRSVDEYPDDPERVAAGRPELLGRGRWPGRVATGDIGRGYCG